MPRAVSKPQKNKTLVISNETELHCRVVDYIRNYHESAILAPGLGEIQDCQSKRIQAWRKGYQRGQPDVMLMNRSGHFSGLAIEFKSPTGTGVVSDEQRLWIEKLRSRGWYAMISNDYTEIVHTISNYFAHEKWICPECNHWTKRVHRHRKSPHTSPEHSEPDIECCSKHVSNVRGQFGTPSTDLPDILSGSMPPHSVCSVCELSVSASGSVSLGHSDVHNEMGAN